MAEIDIPRLGWGEPVTLEGEIADEVRLILGSRDNGSERHRLAIERLRAVFIPPVEACRPTRQTIERVADISHFPLVGDPNYDEEQEALSELLGEANDAYRDRIKGCEMTVDGDRDWFVCDRCDFEQCIFN
ncbi:MAG TPA: hypothetical protein VMR18_03640 [Candidatus Saccharimonadales bacterium]|nr:hypothetical protein [Candidatus Saccharimonadales bacterium]